MNDQYDSWTKAGTTAAVCVDCHLPHDFVPKYIAKADNGYRHSQGVHVHGLPRADHDQAAERARSCRRTVSAATATSCTTSSPAASRSTPHRKGSVASTATATSATARAGGVGGGRCDRYVRSDPCGDGAMGERRPAVSESNPRSRRRTRVRRAARASDAALVRRWRWRLRHASTFVLTALLMTMFDRKQEAKNPYVRVVDVDDNTTDPAVWGSNWPQQFDGYSRTVDQTHTRYGGSDGSPTESRLEHRSVAEAHVRRLRVRHRLPRAPRSRVHAGRPARDAARPAAPQAGACLNCHSSIVPTYRRLGLEIAGKTLADAQGFDWPAVFAGFEKLSVMSYVARTASCSRRPTARPTSVTPTPGGSSLATTTPANVTGHRRRTDDRRPHHDDADPRAAGDRRHVRPRDDVRRRRPRYGDGH